MTETGTGKTTNLSRQIGRAVDRFGRESVLVTSFSRAAAAELAGRDLPIAPERIGTLHAHCYRALGGPPIAEANVDEWNRQYPQLRITPSRRQNRLDGDDAGDEDGRAKAGDLWLQDLNRFRGLMIPPAAWPASLRDFAERWMEYKDALGLLDFTDLIETCHRDVAVAPGRPAVIFVDEAQDLSRLQLTLIRKWGGHCDYFIVCGDEDQTIHSFIGATPEAMLEPEIADDHKIILKQSYRVPRAVHAMADKLIREVTRRQEKAYLPRPADGACVRAPWSAAYARADYWILNRTMEHLEKGQTVMFLTTCAYMLEPVIAVLRKNAIPIHNPYRRSNGFWNPIRLTRKGSTANRILALLSAHPDFGEGKRGWTMGELALWSEWLESKGILRHGSKKKLQAAGNGTEASLEDLDRMFEPGALESLLRAFEGDYRKLLNWWRCRVTAEVHRRVQYPSEIAMTRGPRSLLEQPKVIAGTIHSVKGGEADVVFLFPDLSNSGWTAYRRHGASRDAVIRTFYVGMTRARETLYLCGPESGSAWAWGPVPY
ncbi:MAG: ATP-dependent helicase [Bryobacteraceae bacterium]|nr:ATP-dependent helicase [Bryobacteraceae bacterium]